MLALKQPSQRSKTEVLGEITDFIIEIRSAANDFRLKENIRPFRWIMFTIKSGCEEKWYKYKNEAYRDIAINWCHDNELEWKE